MAAGFIGCAVVLHVFNRQWSPISLREAGKWKGIWFQTGVLLKNLCGTSPDSATSKPSVKKWGGAVTSNPYWCVRELQTFKYLFIHPYLFVCIFHTPFSYFGDMGNLDNQGIHLNFIDVSEDACLFLFCCWLSAGNILFFVALALGKKAPSLIPTTATISAAM